MQNDWLKCRENAPGSGLLASGRTRSPKHVEKDYYFLTVRVKGVDTMMDSYAE